MREDKLQYCTKHHTSYVTECNSCYREKTECQHGVPFDSECGECSKKTRPKVSHYQCGGIEPIDYINSHNFNFNLGNAIKYISRCGKKEGESTEKDLKKAIDYLNFEIERLSKC